MPSPWERFQGVAKSSQLGEDIETAAERYRTGNVGYKPSSESRRYYEKVMGILEEPGQFGLTPGEEEQYMDQARREGELTMRQQGRSFSEWAARRGIEGGVEAKTKIKLLQENLRNLMRARSGLNQLNFNARTQARLAALGVGAQMTQTFENANLMNYQQQLMEQMQRDQLMSDLIGMGTQAALNYFMPGAGTALGIGSTSSVPGFQVMNSSGPLA